MAYGSKCPFLKATWEVKDYLKSIGKSPADVVDDEAWDIFISLHGENSAEIEAMRDWDRRYPEFTYSEGQMIPVGSIEQSFKNKWNDMAKY